MAKNNNWKAVLECADEEGDLSTWAKEINHPVYGRYVWVSSICEGVVVVEVQAPETHEIIELKSCKTVQAAKRWATMNLDIEVEDSGQETYLLNEFESKLEEYDNDETDQKRTLLRKMEFILYNSLQHLTIDNIAQVKRMNKILECKFTDCENLNMSHTSETKKNLVNNSKNLNILSHVVSVLTDNFGLNELLVDLKSRELSVTEYSILLGRRNRLLSYIREKKDSIVDYGVLGDIEMSIYDCGVDEDIADLINEAYVENEEFYQGGVEYELN